MRDPCTLGRRPESLRLADADSLAYSTLGPFPNSTAPLKPRFSCYQQAVRFTRTISRALASSARSRYSSPWATWQDRRQPEDPDPYNYRISTSIGADRLPRCSLGTMYPGLPSNVCGPSTRALSISALKIEGGS